VLHLVDGDREGLLRGFLGALDVAEEADEGGEDPVPLSRNVSSGIATAP
jgi:hypothetical protein